MDKTCGADVCAGSCVARRRGESGVKDLGCGVVGGDGRGHDGA